jgi:membrane protease YdiL (CAAX protease family)
MNFDKPFIGLFLIGFGLPRIPPKGWRPLILSTYPIALAATCALLGLCFLLKFVRPDFKWFEFTWIWLIVNLLFTCVSEEALFRGFLQNELVRSLGSNRAAKRYSWIVTSLLFGLAHLTGGWMYAGLATIAGLFYGYAFLKTQKVEASIWIHFFVNSIHFVAFSYPTLKAI